MFFPGVDPIYMLITIVASLVGAGISMRLRSKFNHYSQVPTSSGQSGAEVARAMLQYYNIHDVQILEGQGYLSDHYNPANKTVNLSPDVYHGRSVAAAAVAAHECGHAVQHATAYSWLQLRSAIVPVVQIAATAQQWLLLIALMLAGNFPSLLLITIVAFMITTAFSLITLPVEFDASNRALAYLNGAGRMRAEEHEGAKDALWWAAMTYVAAALASLVSLLYLIMRYMGTSRDE